MATKKQVTDLAKWMHATFLQCPDAKRNPERFYSSPWSKLKARHKRPYLFVAEKLLTNPPCKGGS